jgi:hypothetical protein
MPGVLLDCVEQVGGGDVQPGQASSIDRMF